MALPGLGSTAAALGGRALGGFLGGGRQKTTVSQSLATSVNASVSPNILLALGPGGISDVATGSGVGGGASAPSAATANDVPGRRFLLPATTRGRASIDTPFPMRDSVAGAVGDDGSAGRLLIFGALAVGAFMLFGQKGKGR